MDEDYNPAMTDSEITAGDGVSNLPIPLFLNCSNHNLFYSKDSPNNIRYLHDGLKNNSRGEPLHSPYLIVMCDNNIEDGKYKNTVAATIRKIERKIEDSGENSVYRYIMVNRDGKMRKTNESIYRSWYNPNHRHRCFFAHVTKSWKVPHLSDALFKDFGLGTCEMDILYPERVLIDLQSDGKEWIFDTGGVERTLKVLAYDLETPQFKKEALPGTIPIEMIGWASFDIKYKATKGELTDKKYNPKPFNMEITSLPDWKEPKIEQMLAGGDAEELEAVNLYRLLRLFDEHDIIAGHNVMAFDNLMVIQRVQWLLANRGNLFTKDQKDFINKYIKTNTKDDNIFSFGEQAPTVNVYPMTFDTYYAAKRIYFFIPEYSLKFLAKHFGYIIDDRVYLDAESISMDSEEDTKTTMLYNEHDVREQIGLTIHLLPDAMRLSFINGMPFEMNMPAGTTKIWDHMAWIRARKKKKIMPAMSVPLKICKEFFHSFGMTRRNGKPWTKVAIFNEARKRVKQDKDAVSKRLLKVIKYRTELCTYLLFPHLVYNPYQKKELQRISDAKKNSCKCDFCLKIKKDYPNLGEKEKGRHNALVESRMRGAGHPKKDLESATYLSGFREKSIGYHFPGGMTIHPDWSDINSHFKQWWSVFVLDVGCLRGDMEIHTSRGFERIEKLEIGDDIYTEDGYQKVIDKREFDADELYEIETERGKRIVCTGDHRFPVLNENGRKDKYARDLLLSDKLFEIISYPLKGGDRECQDYEWHCDMAELIGIFDAEGSIRNEIRDRIRYDRGGYIQKGIHYYNLSFAIHSEEKQFEKRINELILLCFKHICISDEEFEDIKKEVIENIIKDYMCAGQDKIAKKYHTSIMQVRKILIDNGVKIRKKGIKTGMHECFDNKNKINLNNFLKESDLKFNYPPIDGNGITMQIGIGKVVNEFIRMYEKRDFIFGHSDFCRRWLRGFLTGDGCRNKGRDDVIEVGQFPGNYDKLEFTGKCLQRIGIPYSISKPVVVKSGKSEGCITKRLSIPCFYTNKFLDEVGFIEEYKSYRDNKKRKCHGLSGKCRTSKIRSINKIDGGKVFDITVENQNSPYFFANGILTHNSMYPCNLLAENLCGDSVRLADPENYVLNVDSENFIKIRDTSRYVGVDEHYTWIWIKRMWKDILDRFAVHLHHDDLHNDSKYAEMSKRFSFVDEGYIVGIVIDAEDGCVANAMGAVMGVTNYLKRKKFENPFDTQIAMAYQSAKGLRNSGTHGILSAPTVSNRAFSLWAASRITTVGQEVLDDAKKMLLDAGARIVYGDSVDGSRDVIIREDGDIKIVNLIDMFDGMKRTEKEIRDGVGHEYGYTDRNIEVYSCDSGGKSGWKSLQYIKRHEYSGDLIKCRTRRGETIVTPSHSLFELKENELKEIRGKDIEVGTEICHLPLKSNVTTFPVSKIQNVEPTDGFVYDLGVEDNHNFVDAMGGILLHNTDGIYVAASSHADTNDSLSKIWDLSEYDGEVKKFDSLNLRIDSDKWIIEPDKIVEVNDTINDKWQKRLNYPEFELEIETHDGMFFVKHKNYLIFDVKGDEIVMKRKGNNFKAKDKPKVATNVLESIMMKVVMENLSWVENEDGSMSYLDAGVRGNNPRDDIKKIFMEEYEKFDVNMEQGIGDAIPFMQKVAPCRYYKAQEDKDCLGCGGTGVVKEEDKEKVRDFFGDDSEYLYKCPYCDGKKYKMSTFGARSLGIKHLIGDFDSEVRMRCVVCKNTLPFIFDTSKADTKPINYMWPYELVTSHEKAKELCGGIDFDWYKAMLFYYIRGAFGMSDWEIEPLYVRKKQSFFDVTGMGYRLICYRKSKPRVEIAVEVGKEDFEGVGKEEIYEDIQRDSE